MKKVCDGRRVFAGNYRGDDIHVVNIDEGTNLQEAQTENALLIVDTSEGSSFLEARSDGQLLVVPNDNATDEKEDDSTSSTKEPRRE